MLVDKQSLPEALQMLYGTGNAAAMQSTKPLPGLPSASVPISQLQRRAAAVEKSFAGLLVEALETNPGSAALYAQLAHELGYDIRAEFLKVGHGNFSNLYVVAVRGMFVELQARALSWLSLLNAGACRNTLNACAAEQVMLCP